MSQSAPKSDGADLGARFVIGAAVGTPTVVGLGAKLFGFSAFSLVCVIELVGVWYFFGGIVHWWLWIHRPPDGYRFRRGARRRVVKALLIQIFISIVWVAVVSLVLLRSNGIPGVILNFPWIFFLSVAVIPAYLCPVRYTTAAAQRANLEFVAQRLDTSPKWKKILKYLDPVSRWPGTVAARSFLVQDVRPGAISNGAASILLILFILAFSILVVSGGPAAKQLVTRLKSHKDEGKSRAKKTAADCPGGRKLNRGLPRDVASSFGKVFKREGAVQAGCRQPAVKVHGQRTWVAQGLCQGQLRSVAVVTRKPGGVGLLYQQAGSFAWQKASEGSLISASDRIDTMYGDLYIVTTTNGTYLVIRAQKNYGGRRTPSNPKKCEDVSDKNFPYTIVPPGMLPLWMEVMNYLGWTWPVSSEGESRSGQRFSLVSSTLTERVADIECSSDQECELEFQGRKIKSSDFRPFNLTWFEAMVPPVSK